MATISFKQNVVIRDPKKIKEIKSAMASKNKAFSDIKPDINNTKEKEIIRKCFFR